MIGCARFLCHNLNPNYHFKIDQQFMLKFILIYAILVHILHQNLPEPKLAHDRTRADPARIRCGV
jgi:hypothetical protein